MGKFILRTLYFSGERHLFCLEEQKSSVPRRGRLVLMVGYWG